MQFDFPTVDGDTYGVDNKFSLDVARLDIRDSTLKEINCDWSEMCFELTLAYHPPPNNMSHEQPAISD